MQTDERIGGDLQVEVGALGRDEVAQRVIEIESHTRLFIGAHLGGLERCVPVGPTLAIAPRAASASLSAPAACARRRSAPSVLRRARAV